MTMTIDDEQQFEEVLGPDPGGSLLAVWQNRLEAGSCNFCNRPHIRVLVVQGNTIEARFCPKCHAGMNEMAKVNKR